MASSFLPFLVSDSEEAASSGGGEEGETPRLASVIRPPGHSVQDVPI